MRHQRKQQKQKPHQQKPVIKLVVGDGEIEFRSKDQKSWPQRDTDKFVLTYREMLGRHVQGTRIFEFDTYEDAWTEARALGVKLMHWPEWLRGRKTQKFSTKKGVVDLPFSEYEKR